MSNNVKTFTHQSWQTEVINTNGLVIADAWAPWCAPCRIVGPIIDELADDFFGKRTNFLLNNNDYNALNMIGGMIKWD
ncbi:MAG: thioredoxin family protein [Fidelibacterota bacterium]|jgi:thioredoxin 1